MYLALKVSNQLVAAVYLLDYLAYPDLCIG
jgi:hypothetical protein